jgi:hypothetical protein
VQPALDLIGGRITPLASAGGVQVAGLKIELILRQVLKKIIVGKNIFIFHFAAFSVLLVKLQTSISALCAAFIFYHSQETSYRSGFHHLSGKL